MGGQARGRPKTAGDPVHKHQPDLRVGREVTFDEVIATLYARKINCGVATFWNAGITVWIGDGMNGRLAETTFSRHRMGEAAQWLVDEAARLYPKKAVR